MCSVILDGSTRRFQAQKIHLRAMAAMKWVSRRNAILQGRKPTNGNIVLLQQADNTLRTVRFHVIEWLCYLLIPALGPRSDHERENIQWYPQRRPTSSLLDPRRPFAVGDTQLDSFALLISHLACLPRPKVTRSTANVSQALFQYIFPMWSEFSGTDWRMSNRRSNNR